MRTSWLRQDLYLHSGGGANEHAELTLAIERSKQASLAAGQEDNDVPRW